MFLGTTAETVEDGGIPFEVRLIEGLAKKPTLADNKEKKKDFDPFMPPFEPGLFIADLSDTHRLLFNKFPISREHTLVITKDFVKQETPLCKNDWYAAAVALNSLQSFMFFNRGKLSGMSCPHKHIQLMPFASQVGGTLPVE